jgi:ubiquinone/menaquinone biosynthesis C-methylase UbiE
MADAGGQVRPFDFEATLQAEQLAAAPALDDAQALELLVQAGRPGSWDYTLDVACGPGAVVAAFAAHAGRSVGLDALEENLYQGRKLVRDQGLRNVEFRRGDVMTRLPFSDRTFSVVTCRGGFHRFEQPSWALFEMQRVCRPGGRIVVCDVFASIDPAKAQAFNGMERHRERTTVEYLTLEGLRALFDLVELPRPKETFYRVEVEREALIEASLPVNNDRDLLRRLIDRSLDGDRLGLNAREEGYSVTLSYPTVIMTSVKKGFVGRWLGL